MPSSTGSDAASPLRAVIDIGTNTALMLVGRRREDGRVETVRDASIITRLGRDAVARRRLQPQAIERTLQALRQHREQAEADGAQAIVAVATESLRMVDNAGDFLDPASRILGTEIRIVSGDEEARLSYASVAQECPPEMPLRVLDIGGGSTELVAGHGTRIDVARSFPVGSVRFTERHVQHDPPSPQSLVDMYEAALQAFSAQSLDPWPTLHGLAGTVTTAGALLLGLSVYDRDRIDGTQLGRSDIEGLRDELAGETLAERQRRPCLPEGRADVIVAGLTILLAAADHCGAEHVIVRDRGLRYALL